MGAGVQERPQISALRRESSSRNSQAASPSAISIDETHVARRHNSSHNSEGSKPNRFQAPTSFDFERLPPKPYSDLLVKGFLQGYQALSPLIHVPTFMKDYHRFWAAPTREENSFHPSAAFISLLYAILYAGSVVVSKTIQEQFSEKPRQVVSQKLYELTMQALRQANYVRTPAIESFAAFLISQSTRLRGGSPTSHHLQRY